MTFSTLVGGHRGLPKEFPDNSLDGIVAGAQVSQIIELDVRSSADGYRVLSHDPDIAGIDVYTSTWEEIQAINMGDGHTPALLDEVLEALPDFPLDIEIKNWPGESGFDPTHAFAVEVAGMARHIDVVTCFFWPTMHAIKAAYPLLKTGLLVDQGGSVDDAISVALEHGHDLIAPHWSLLLGRTFDVERDGVEIATWTVDDPEIAISLANAGVGTIITNDPKTIGAAIRGAQENS